MRIDTETSVIIGLTKQGGNVRLFFNGPIRYSPEISVKRGTHGQKYPLKVLSMKLGNALYTHLYVYVCKC